MVCLYWPRVAKCSNVQHPPSIWGHTHAPDVSFVNGFWQCLFEYISCHLWCFAILNSEFFVRNFLTYEMQLWIEVLRLSMELRILHQGNGPLVILHYWSGHWLWKFEFMMLQLWYRLLLYAYLIHQTGTFIFYYSNLATPLFPNGMPLFYIHLQTSLFLLMTCLYSDIYDTFIISTYDLSLSTNTYNLCTW